MEVVEGEFKSGRVKEFKSLRIIELQLRVFRVVLGWWPGDLVDSQDWLSHLDAGNLIVAVAI